MCRFYLKTVFLIFMLGLTGCVHITKPVALDAKPEGKKGYIYGKFKLEADASDLDVVLIIAAISKFDKDGKEYRLIKPKKYGLKFNKVGDVYGIAVEPGIYKIHGFQYGNEGRLMQRNNDFASDGVLSKLVTVRPGNAYYAGDWQGTADVTVEYPMTYYKWKLTKLSFEFNKTNQEFLRRYPNFGDFPRDSLYSPDYSTQFDPNNPDTYNLEDLLKAIGYLNHNLAFKVASYLADIDSEAKSVLAYLYEKGLSVEKDFSKAVQLYVEAVKDKSPRAMFRLSGLFFEWGKEQPKGSEKRKDYTVKGATYLTLAAIYGNERAIAGSCRMSSVEGASEGFLVNAWAWCSIGKKLLTEENRGVFKKTAVLDNRKKPDDSIKAKIAQKEQFYISAMKKHGVDISL